MRRMGKNQRGTETDHLKNRLKRRHERGRRDRLDIIDSRDPKAGEGDAVQCLQRQNIMHRVWRQQSVPVHTCEVRQHRAANQRMMADVVQQPLRIVENGNFQCDGACDSSASQRHRATKITEKAENKKSTFKVCSFRQLNQKATHRIR
jgi:hypothetical protein